jgi:CheY-like chemotaxis protein
MYEILYIALRPNELLANAFRDAGQKLTHLCPESALERLQHGNLPPSVIVLQWRSRRDQAIIARAKMLGLPVLAITSRLAAALRVAGVHADLYLEDPVTESELLQLAVDLQRALPERRISSGTAHAQTAVHV